MLLRATVQAAEKPRGFAPSATRRTKIKSAPTLSFPRVRGRVGWGAGEDGLSNFVTIAHRWGVLSGLALSLGLVPAHGQQSRPWLDPTLLAAAKAEGGPLTVYSSTNEQEGFPLFKIFEDATGIKVQYVRAADSVLTSRMSIEFRADQKSYDIVHMTTINKLPPQMLAQYTPPEAKHIPAHARDPNGRWFGVYANYNTPAYNTQKVKASELPKSYEEFAQRKEWAGKVAIDGTDNEWLKALLMHYGEQKGTEIARTLATNLNPVLTNGHLALARANGAGEYLLSINNYTNLTLNVRLGGAPLDFFALDPVALFFGQVGINAKAPNPNAARLAANFMLSQECQQFLAKFGRLPTRADVKSNPPGALEQITKRKVVTVLLAPDEERSSQRAFDAIFKRR
jgi:iron(III) transport system substrate-binding protein